MLKEERTQRRQGTWLWPVVIAAVVVALVCIQFLRVNRPQETATSEPPTVYTPAGSLVDGQVIAPAKDFYSSRIELNRRSRLTGSFRTPNILTRVTVLVLTEDNFENWKSGADHQALAQTGSVPGGKINVVLEPGVFFLVIDNRQGGSNQSVYTNFILER